MRKMSKYTSLFDKYANLKEDTGRHLCRYEWKGHMYISGTFNGDAYSTKLANGYMADNLRSEANPKGSILVEAKNYTDSKIKHIHYIKLTSDTAEVYFTYMSTKADPYNTIESLISSLNSKPRIACSGYYGNLAILYITASYGTITLGVFEPAKGKITPMTMAFNTINDVVE